MLADSGSTFLIVCFLVDDVHRIIQTSLSKGAPAGSPASMEDELANMISALKLNET